MGPSQVDLEDLGVLEALCVRALHCWAIGISHKNVFWCIGIQTGAFRILHILVSRNVWGVLQIFYELMMMVSACCVLGPESPGVVCALPFEMRVVDAVIRAEMAMEMMEGDM